MASPLLFRIDKYGACQNLLIIPYRTSHKFIPHSGIICHCETPLLLFPGTARQGRCGGVAILF